MNLLSKFILAFLPFCLLSCVSISPKIISSEKIVREIQWTEEEKVKPLAVRLIRKTEEASFHVIRLSASEKPHYHDHHDLTVFMLRGKVRMHLGNSAVRMNPGDVLEVPRGSMHWAETLGRDASEVYAVFTPPHDGKDYREANL